MRLCCPTPFSRKCATCQGHGVHGLYHLPTFVLTQVPPLHAFQLRLLPPGKRDAMLPGRGVLSPRAQLACSHHAERQLPGPSPAGALSAAL